MAELLKEGFEVHRTVAALQKKWKTVGTQFNDPSSFTAGRFFGTALRTFSVTEAQGVLLSHPFAAGSQTTIIAGIACRIVDPEDNVRFLTFLDGSDTADQLAVHIRAVGATDDYFFEARRGATLLGTSPTFTGSHSTWQYFEFKVTIHASTGAFVMRANKTVVLNLSGINTSNIGSGGCDRIQWAFAHDSSSATDRVEVDDIYMIDGTGSAPLNDFLGDVMIEGSMPNAAGNSSQMTPVGAAAPNFNCVDDPNVSDDAATYVEEGTVGEKDTYGMQDLQFIAGSILSLTVYTEAALESSGSRGIKTVVRHSGSDNLSAERTIDDTAFKEGKVDYPVNPGTGVAWTVADVNAVEIGQQVSA